jgi:hypothetical protein
MHQRLNRRPGRWRPVVAAIGIALLAPGVLATAAAGSASLRSLTIQTTEFSFRAPDSVPAGWTRVTIRNIGGEDHQAQVARLNPGVTFAQLQATAAKGDPATLLTLVTPVGGPNAVGPGQSATTIDNLTPGQYALICFLFSSDGTEHDAKGMMKLLTVTPTRGSRAAAPRANSTVSLGDFSFAFPSKFTAKGVVAVKNDGSQSHEMAIYRLQRGKTVTDAKAFFATPPGTAPSTKPPGTFVGGIAGIAPGATGYADLNLAAGNYVAVCFFPDTAKNGLPHFLEGMIQPFRIQ